MLMLWNMSIVISLHRHSSSDQTLCCIQVVQLKFCHLFISKCMKRGIHIASLWFHRACCCRDKSSSWG